MWADNIRIILMRVHLRSIFLFLLITLHSLNIYSYTYIDLISKFEVKSFFYQDSLDYKKELSKIDSIVTIQSNYGLALEMALNLSLDQNIDADNKYELLLQIANIYDKTSNYPRSLSYYIQALLSFEKFDNRDIQTELFQDRYAFNLLRIGGAYQKMRLNDSAMAYYRKVDGINSISDKILSAKAIAYTNMSGIFQIDSIFSEAEKYSLKSLEIQRLRNDKLNQALALVNLGSVYLSQGQFKKSKEIYLKGIKLIEKDNSEKAVRYKASLYANLAWAMRNLKEYEAYDKLYDSYQIKDELRRKDIQQIVETVTRKHNVDLVKKEAEIQSAKASKRTWIIVFSAITVILLLLAFIISYNFRQKNLNLELREKESEQERKLSQLKAESQALILNAALDGKESERREIAETLHDNVSTLLSSANLHLQACKTQFNGKTPVEVDKTQIIINEASQKIRDLSHTLISSVLLKFGLSFAVNDMIKKFSNSQISIEGDIQDLPRFKQKFEIKVYNIIQELVNNVLKHSEADKASIHLSQNNNKLIILISDNGKGFDKTKISVKDGLGINQIDARIQMMKGKFDINSRLQKGTSIVIELPIHELEEAKTA